MAKYVQVPGVDWLGETRLIFCNSQPEYSYGGEGHLLMEEDEGDDQVRGDAVQPKLRKDLA